MPSHSHLPEAYGETASLRKWLLAHFYGARAEDNMLVRRNGQVRNGHPRTSSSAPTLHESRKDKLFYDRLRASLLYNPVNCALIKDGGKWCRGTDSGWARMVQVPVPVQERTDETLGTIGWVRNRFKRPSGAQTPRRLDYCESGA